MTDTAPLPQMDAPGAAPDATASHWKLMWLRFCQHKLALFSLLIVGLIYLVALLAEFLAPFPPQEANARHVYHPPQGLHFFVNDDNGFRFQPHVTAFRMERDPVSLRTSYVEDEGQIIPVAFFGRSTPYRLWGVIPMDRQLIAPVEAGQRFFIMGTDRLGRDMLSRLIHGTRVSMTLGLAGVGISLVLGLLLGGLSGYYGGRIDWVIQRLIEYILSLPTIPLWMALAAAMPRNWPPTLQYFTITCIVSLVGWTELARVVRGRFLAMRDESFVVAARLDGCSQRRVIFRHMLPSLASHIIASVTLAVPLMIIAETSLSFLGLGLQPPAISWGVLLQEAQNIRSITQAPWLFIPGALVVVAVLSLNFIGDGLRDAADPYSK
ncbi:ABC transporter permease [Pelagibacterium montanilacus]|uniref:ABC transporter permease n=1 Tax=Pelagibacterium montanilacus TaxID=2185280 RepID=UPI000F8DC441|nr:ABC transporter permease [Pelagibacterium montanilacus]